MMVVGSKRETSRRDFLKGRSAVQTLRELAEARAAPLPPPASAAAAGSEGRRPAFLLQFSRRAMAAEFQIYLHSNPPPGAADAACEALELVESLERQMSVFREDSQIADINRRAAREPIEVEPRLFALIQQAVALSEATGGALDITTGPLSKIWGFHRRQGRFPEQRHVD